MRLEGWHLIIIIAIAILLFGAPKLPGLARSLGQSLRIFKSEVRQMKEDGNDTDGGKPPLVSDHHDTDAPQGTGSAQTADSDQVPGRSDEPGTVPGGSVPTSSRTL